MGFVHHALNRTTEVVFLGGDQIGCFRQFKKAKKSEKEVKRLSFRIMNLRFSCF